jgi:HlyD family secretion protein
MGIAFGIGLLGLLIVAALQVRREGLPVEVERAKTGTVRATIAVSGTVQPVTTVRVTTGMTGRVVEVPVREGQVVREGVVLLRLDPARAEAAVRQRQAELASAEADARAAQATLRLSEEKAARLERLAAKYLVSVEELQNARNQAQIHAAQYAAAQERVQQSRAGLDAAQEDVGQTVIRASMAGTVVSVAVEAGETVTGSAYGAGSTVMYLADLSAMIVRASVDEADIARVQTGQTVEVRVDALPDTLLQGRVARMARTALAGDASGGEHEPVTFPIDIALPDPPPALRPGMSAQGSIVTEAREAVVTVPLQAVVEGRDGTYVYRLYHTLVRRTRVATGLSDEMRVEIREGLHAGEAVVTGSARMLRVLKDGDRVTPTFEEAAAGPLSYASPR